jgi:hypothetical protein
MKRVREVAVRERGIAPEARHVTTIRQTTAPVEAAGRVGRGLGCLGPIPHTLGDVLLIRIGRIYLYIYIKRIYVCVYMIATIFSLCSSC